MGDSPDETAFFKWEIRKLLLEYEFKDVTVVPFDFLHPSIPDRMVPFFERLGEVVERIPIIREIAGSLYIAASK